MRHIRLFENFDQSADTSGLVFDWLPFDNEVNNPINNSVPSEIGLNEMIDYCNKNNDIEGVGLFIAHKKNSSGGFTRYVTTSINPLLLDSAIFDSEFKKVTEMKGLDPSKTSVGDFGKGSSMMGRFGHFGKGEQ